MSSCTINTIHCFKNKVKCAIAENMEVARKCEPSMKIRDIRVLKYCGNTCTG